MISATRTKPLNHGAKLSGTISTTTRFSSSGVAKKFSFSSGDDGLKVFHKRSSGIPRPNINPGIHKMVGQTGIVKSKSRLSINSSLGPKRKTSSKPSISETETYQSNLQKKGNVNADIKKEKHNPVFKEVIPLKKKTSVPSHRRVFSNLSNSPLASLSGQPANKIQSHNSTSKIQNVENEPFSHMEKAKDKASNPVVEFQSDPNALASILNDEGITSTLLQQTNLENETQGRFSVVKDNTFLQADGRPSLCRRVPIQRRASQVERRSSMTSNGPKRVISSRKKLPGNNVGLSNNTQQQRNSFIKSMPLNSRHSLYSVVQGRYSNNAQSSVIGRQSLPIGTKPIVNKQVKEQPFKSPQAQRVVSGDVRISASPALRIPAASNTTPLPQRAKKKGQDRGVRWADENSPLDKGSLAINLFQESPTAQTPLPSAQSKQLKSPVSILKSRKHIKRNSLTPPMTKKDKKIEKLQKEDEDGTVELVFPKVLNEADQQDEKASHLMTSSSFAQAGLNVATKKTTSPSIIAKKTKEITPRIKAENSPTLQMLDKNPEKDRSKKTENGSNLIPVEQVLQIMNRKMGSVKRRSVQVEFSKVMQSITATLKESRFNAVGDIQEEPVAEENEYHTSDTNASIEIKKTTAQSSPQKTKQPPFVPLTPGTIMDIRENCDEDTNRDLDSLTMETARINEELRQLQREREKLDAFQRKVKTRLSKPKRILPVAIKSEKLPLASPTIATSSQPATSSMIDDALSKSWEKLLRSDMRSIRYEDENYVDAKSQSLDLSIETSSSARKRYIESLSPCLSALHLDEPSSAVLAQNNRVGTVKSEPNSILTMSSSQPQFKFEPLKGEKTTPDASISRNDCKFATTSSNVDHLHHSFVHPLGRTSYSKDIEDFSAEVGFQNLPTMTTSYDKATRHDDVLNGDLNCFSPTQHKLSDAHAQPLDKKQVAHNTIAVRSPSAVDATAKESSFVIQQVTKECSNATETSASVDSMKPVFNINASLDTYNMESTSANTELKSSDYTLKNNQETVTERPCPRFPLPPQTPAVFRVLRSTLKEYNSNVSPFKEKMIATTKQQFAQALLDEEVSLLTCRVVKPSQLLSSKVCQNEHDPVARSLTVGDSTHFVPIPKTPSTPKRGRSSFSDSAFSKFLRS